MENLLNVNQVAFILKVHPLSIRRYIREGKLKAIRVGGNIRITEAELHAFQNQEVKPKPPSPFTGINRKQRPAKTFTSDDPFFRLQGRGASFNIT